MTRPDWSTAPKWATWAAMDSTGAWYWFENEPVASDGLRMFTASGFKIEACVIAGWKDTAHQRPGPLRLTADAPHFTLEQFRAKGWTDEQLIAHGYAERES